MPRLKLRTEDIDITISNGVRIQIPNVPPGVTIWQTSSVHQETLSFGCGECHKTVSCVPTEGFFRRKSHAAACLEIQERLLKHHEEEHTSWDGGEYARA